ncbi:hypothetical protein GCM10028787_31560 [Brachybacterium horti]
MKTIHTAPLEPPTAPPSEIPAYRRYSRMALADARAAFARNDPATARTALADARVLIRELLAHSPEDGNLHIAYNATNTAAFLVEPIFTQYTALALQKLA